MAEIKTQKQLGLIPTGETNDLLSLTLMSSREIRLCITRMMARYVNKDASMADEGSFGLIREAFRILEWKLKVESGMLYFTLLSIIFVPNTNKATTIVIPPIHLYLILIHYLYPTLETLKQ